MGAVFLRASKSTSISLPHPVIILSRIVSLIALLGVVIAPAVFSETKAPSCTDIWRPWSRISLRVTQDVGSILSDDRIDLEMAMLGPNRRRTKTTRLLFFGPILKTMPGWRSIRKDRNQPGQFSKLKDLWMLTLIWSQNSSTSTLSLCSLILIGLTMQVSSLSGSIDSNLTHPVGQDKQARRSNPLQFSLSRTLKTTYRIPEERFPLDWVLAKRDVDASKNDLSMTMDNWRQRHLSPHSGFQVRSSWTREQAR